MLKNLTIALTAGLFLTACAGDKSVKVASLQKKDKNLSCSEVMLEINEADFYRKTAERNKGPKVKSLLMPLGYISTYVNAEEAIGAAAARVDYLNRIYEILDCDNLNTANTAPPAPRKVSAPEQQAPSQRQYQQRYVEPQYQGGYQGNTGYAPNTAPAYYAPRQVPQNRSASSERLGDDWYW